MTELNELAKKALLAAGHQLGVESAEFDRKVKQAEKAGFTTGDAFVRFLKFYEGVEFQHPSYATEGQEKIHLSIDKLGSDFDPEATIEYVERTGVDLIPIGEANNEHLLLLLAQDGALYGAYDDYLTKLGDDFEDGVNALFDRRPTSEIPDGNSQHS